MPARARWAGNLRVELYIDEGARDFNRALLAVLEEQKEEIEKELGQEVVWDGRGNSRKCAIFVARKSAPGDTQDLVAGWAADWLQRVHGAFVPRYELASVRASQVVDAFLGSAGLPGDESERG